MATNNLVVPDWLSNCTALVAQMTPLEKAQSYYACQVIAKKLEPEIRKGLFNGEIDNFEFTANGTPIVLSLCRGKISAKDVICKSIDYDKAIAFAKEHNFEIPMTERIVIEPQVDKVKLETMEWFQNNADLFITKKVETKTTHSYDKILWKEKK